MNTTPGQDRVLFALMAVAGAIWMLFLTPRAYKDIVASRLMTDYATTSGIVVEVNKRGKCASTATIEYKVGDIRRQTLVGGCGISASRGLLGSTAEVKYARADAGVVDAPIGDPGNRMGWGTIFGGWGAVVACALLAYWSPRFQAGNGRKP